MNNNPESLFVRQLRAFQEYDKPVRVFMSNGIGLNGKVIGYDETTLLLEAERGHMPVMVERQGILSVMLADASGAYLRRFESGNLDADAVLQRHGDET